MLHLVPSSQQRKSSLEKATARYAASLESNQPARDYLERRGLLHIAGPLRFGVVESPLAEHRMYEGRLAIPFLGPKGNVYDIRYRCLADHDCHEAKCPKYLGDPGVQTRLWNTAALAANTRTVLVTEGELDAATLVACNLPAVGVPGANGWREHYPRVLAKYEQVVVVGDGDKAGRDFASRVVKTMRSVARAVIISGEDGANDVNDFYVRHGKDELLKLLKGESE